MLYQSKNQLLEQSYLPHANREQKLVGMGFSRLRREIDPQSKRRESREDIDCTGSTVDRWV